WYLNAGDLACLETGHTNFRTWQDSVHIIQRGKEIHMMNKRFLAIPDQEQASAEQQHSRKYEYAHDGIVDFHSGLRYQSSHDLAIAFVQFGCRAKANQAALVQYGNAVGDSSCTPHVVGDDYKRRTILLLNFEEEIVDFRGGDPVESAAWLVDQ